jgi:hypothetical protein
MKIRTLVVSILGVLVVSSTSLAQDVEAPVRGLQEPAIQQPSSVNPWQAEPSAGEPLAQVAPQAPRSRSRDVLPTPPSTPAKALRNARPVPREIPTEVRILELRYAKAVDMSNMILEVFGIKVHFDQSLNRLIVNATKEQLETIMSVIQEMDVPNPETSTPREIQDLVYRIYMFEVASEDDSLRPFTMILEVPLDMSTLELLDAARPHELQISGFCLRDEEATDGWTEILIQGKADSHVTLKRMVSDAIPDSQIIELKWDDSETFTSEIAAAQFTQLPEQMQKHIGKFLGDDIRTVGYWFGNLSVPGEVQTPIGPWILNLQLDLQSDRMLELNVGVEIPGEMHNFDTRLGRERTNEILSNTIRAKIGKPIIIGYNRESYGTRKMGAMVIVPEVDSL